MGHNLATLVPQVGPGSDIVGNATKGQSIQKTNTNTNTVLNEDQVLFAVLIVIVVGLLLVNLWLRVLDNFCYQVLNLDHHNFSHTLFIALIITFILVYFIISLRLKPTTSIAENIV